MLHTLCLRMIWAAEWCILKAVCCAATPGGPGCVSAAVDVHAMHQPCKSVLCISKELGLQSWNGLSDIGALQVALDLLTCEVLTMQSLPGLVGYALHVGQYLISKQ